MQDTAREHWLNAVKTKHEPDTFTDMEVEDFGFWLGDYDTALETGWIFQRYRILPRAGGWLDQHVQDRADILLYLRGITWASIISGADYEGVPSPRRSEGTIPTPLVGKEMTDF